MLLQENVLVRTEIVQKLNIQQTSTEHAEVGGHHDRPPLRPLPRPLKKFAA